MAALRHRGAAIDRRRARVHINQVGIERAVHHLTALPGIDAEPAARRHIGAFLQADRRVQAVTGAIAQRQFGARRARHEQNEKTA